MGGNSSHGPIWSGLDPGDAHALCVQAEKSMGRDSAGGWVRNPPNTIDDDSVGQWRNDAVDVWRDDPSDAVHVHSDWR